MKSYNGKININFYNSKNTKWGSAVYLLINDFDWFVFRTGTNYYPEVFLEEWKYVIKGKKILKYIIDDFWF